MATQSRLPAFLLTRPTAQSDRFAGQLRKRFGADIAVTISPLMAPRLLARPLPEGLFDALIFTSETGVAAFSAHPARPDGLPMRAYCVGNQTAMAAHKIGLVPVSADGNASALIDLIMRDAPRGPLLHICGAHTRGEIAETLTNAGIAAQACVLYDQVAQPLSGTAQALLQGKSTVLAPLFSPRSAKLFSDAVEKHAATAPLTCIALSDAVGAALSNLPGVTVCYAKTPTAESLLDAIAASLAVS